MRDEARGLLVVGVGGQGVVLASAVTADALVSAGYDVKQTEVKGMAQRGGSVFSHLRFGRRVFSPLVPLGTAEVLVAFEWAEALRWLPYLRPGGAVLADLHRIVPPGACRDRRAWTFPYPAMDARAFQGWAGDVRLLDASGVASDLGEVRAANSVLLGALANLLDVDETHWKDAIRRYVPRRSLEINLAAFGAGRELSSLPLEDAASPRVPSVQQPPPDIEIVPEWCKGCDICVRVCPEYCLAMDDRRKVVVVAPEACTACRLCEWLCPDFAIAVHPRSVPHPDGRARGARTDARAAQPAREVAAGG